MLNDQMILQEHISRKLFVIFVIFPENLKLCLTEIRKGVFFGSIFTGREHFVKLTLYLFDRLAGVISAQQLSLAGKSLKVLTYFPMCKV
jgi:hypothetical protein